jgi:pyruvate/2-oxoglutarate dehydrogenase complex dihydrolipoamide dehydrogenase (E3) component
MKHYPKPKSFDANLIVIGAGSAGLVSAYIAAAVQAKVILIEKNKMGGDCLNTGCVPSKALIRAAKYAYQISQAKKYGMKNASVEFEFPDIMARVHEVIKTIEPHDSVERYTNLGVEVIQGAAMLTSPYSVEVNGKTLTAKSIIIAAGAEPFVPPIKDIENITPLTSDNLWDITVLPKKLVVLGGGPIGCELAQSFQRLGSEVTQVEMLPRLMIREDEEVSAFIQKQFETEGVNVLCDHKAVEFKNVDGRKSLLCEHQGEITEIEFDQVLIAVGRAARLEGFGLKELEVPISKRRSIEVNEFMQAGYPSLYACGDIAGPYQFTHTASHQAWYASVNALFGIFKKFKIDYSVIPWATFTDPEVARVGFNKQEADEQGIAYEITRYPLDDLDRAIAEGEDQGYIEVLTRPGKDKILGVTIVGSQAGEMIAEFVFAMRHNLGMNKILSTIHIYPTRNEAVKFSAGNWKKAHTKAWQLSILKRFHAWQRK